MPLCLELLLLQEALWGSEISDHWRPYQATTFSRLPDEYISGQNCERERILCHIQLNEYNSGYLCDIIDYIMKHFFPHTGLDSDESYEGVSEASFKDAQVFESSSQKNNGSVPQENGIKKHRYCCIPAPPSTKSDLLTCTHLSCLARIWPLKMLVQFTACHCADTGSATISFA